MWGESVHVGVDTCIGVHMHMRVHMHTLAYAPACVYVCVCIYMYNQSNQITAPNFCVLDGKSGEHSA